MIRLLSIWLTLALAGMAMVLSGCQTSLDPPEPYANCNQCNGMQTAAARCGAELPMP